ncbi:hypothetical protein PIB30_037858, partial [Stylosanthes scabra]|nr:hypothetical protein [Stylosanthes scabra]
NQQHEQQHEELDLNATANDGTGLTKLTGTREPSRMEGPNPMPTTPKTGVGLALSIRDGLVATVVTRINTDPHLCDHSEGSDQTSTESARN